MSKELFIREIYEPYRDWLAKLEGVFLASNQIIVQNRNTIKLADMKIKDQPTIKVVIKSFKQPSWIQGVIYANFRRPKAVRSFKASEKLLQNDISVPSPIAFLTYQKGGRLTQSYYVSSWWDSNYTLNDLLKGKAKSRMGIEEILRQVADFTFRQHDLGIMHLDYNPGNILIREAEGKCEFSLVDLNRMHFGKLSYKERVFGLVRLTDDEALLSVVAEVYAKLYGVDEVCLVKELVKRNQRFRRNRQQIQRIKNFVRNKR